MKYRIEFMGFGAWLPWAVYELRQFRSSGIVERDEEVWMEIARFADAADAGAYLMTKTHNPRALQVIARDLTAAGQVVIDSIYGDGAVGYDAAIAMLREAVAKARGEK